MAEAATKPKKKAKVLSEESLRRKKASDVSRARTRVNIGPAFTRWRVLKEEEGHPTDADLAAMLLDYYEAYGPNSSVSTTVKCCDHPAPLISSIEVKSESCTVVRHPDDSTCAGKQGDLPCDQQTHAHTPMTGDAHLRGGSEITMTTNVSYEEGCTGITFDISEITVATDEDSDSCLNQEKGGGEDEDEEEESEETHSTEEFDDSDPDWGNEVLPASELFDSDSDQLEKEELNEVHRKARELCPDCGKFFYVGKTHTCEYKIKPFPCNICGKRCKDEGALKSHGRIHEEDYQHFCKFCLAPFKTRREKMAHQAAHILNEKPYKCPDCTMTFSKLRARNFHLKEHRGPKSVSCPHCPLVFPANHCLKRHMLVHTGERQFVCEFCSRLFNQPGHLKSHLRIHTVEKPYKCQHCDKSFNHNVSLKSHVTRYHEGASDSGPTGDLEEEMKPTTARMEENNEKRMSNGDTEEGTGGNVIDRDLKLKEPERKGIKKTRVRSMGRPIGRPKRNPARGETNSNPAVQGQARDPADPSEPAEEGRLKRASPRCIDSDRSDSEPISEPTAEDQLSKESRGRKSKRKASQRLRTFENAEEGSDSDSDFDPAEDEVRKRQTGLKKSANVGGRRGRMSHN